MHREGIGYRLDFSTYTRIIVFDLETTGEAIERDEVIAFAAVVLKPSNGGLRLEKTISHTVKASTALSQRVRQKTNLTDEMVKAGIEVAHLANMIEALFSQRALLVGYGVQFDVDMIMHMMAKRKPNYRFQSSVLDLETVYRDRHLEACNLEAMLERYAVTRPKVSKILDNTFAVYELFKRMHERESVATYIDVLIDEKAAPFDRPKRMPHVINVGAPEHVGAIKKALRKR